MSVTNVRVGAVLINNDPRKKGERVTVKAVINNGSVAGIAKYQTTHRWCSVSFKRIFDDGKNRAVGYNLAPAQYDAPAEDAA